MSFAIRSKSGRFARAASNAACRSKFCGVKSSVPTKFGTLVANSAEFVVKPSANRSDSIASRYSLRAVINPCRQM